jgi:hypothetical protein
MSCHARFAPGWMKRGRLRRGRHGGWSRLGVGEPVNEFDPRPFEHPILSSREGGCLSLALAPWNTVGRVLPNEGFTPTAP